MHNAKLPWTGLYIKLRVSFENFEHQASKQAIAEAMQAQWRHVPTVGGQHTDVRHSDVMKKLWCAVIEHHVFVTASVRTPLKAALGHGWQCSVQETREKQAKQWYISTYFGDINLLLL